MTIFFFFFFLDLSPCSTLPPFNSNPLFLSSGDLRRLVLLRPPPRLRRRRRLHQDLGPGKDQAELQCQLAAAAAATKPKPAACGAARRGDPPPELLWRSSPEGFFHFFFKCRSCVQVPPAEGQQARVAPSPPGRPRRRLGRRRHGAPLRRPHGRALREHQSLLLLE